MKFNQYYLECLSSPPYLIGDEHRACRGHRSAARRLRIPRGRNGTGDDPIELVIETHFHADFLSGHLSWPKPPARGSSTPRWRNPEFDFMGRRGRWGALLARRGDVGVPAYPGHLRESLSIVIYEHADDDRGLRCADW